MKGYNQWPLGEVKEEKPNDNGRFILVISSIILLFIIASLAL